MGVTQHQTTGISITDVSATGTTISVEWEAEIWETAEYEIDILVGPVAGAADQTETYTGPASWGTTVARETTFDVGDAGEYGITAQMDAPAIVHDSSTVTVDPIDPSLFHVNCPISHDTGAELDTVSVSWEWQNDNSIGVDVDYDLFVGGAHLGGAVRPVPAGGTIGQEVLFIPREEGLSWGTHDVEIEYDLSVA